MNATNKILARYTPVVEFLGKALGNDYEVALHDFSGGKYSIIAIANGFNSGRQVGSPITGKALDFVTNRTYEKENYQINYMGRVGNDILTRSSTMFIKDDNGKLLGMLCINYNTSRCKDAVDKILELFQIPTLSDMNAQFDARLDSHAENAEYFADNIEHLISSVLRQLMKDTSTPRDRLTQEEKIEIVRSLNSKGIFLIKGAVSEVASQLCTSEATIYRYLGKINKEQG